MQTSEKKLTVLLVDDDPQARESMCKILELAGYDVVVAVDGQQALDFVRSARLANGEARFHVVLTDVRMPRMGGLEFLRALSLCGDKIPVVLMSAFGRVQDAVWAMKFGAVDFLSKPFKRQVLLAAVAAAAERVKAAPVEPSGPSLIGNSEAMKRLKVEMEQVARTSATVLVTGESGTGKELVTRCIHHFSDRSQHPWLALNCAAVPEQLIESELFGHEKGAFTGAGNVKEGLFEAADRGSLLLDEIGDMPLPLQAKLLRVLQEGEFRRVGSTAAKQVDVRVIAATHRDLRDCAKRGTFREDLLYRLEVVTLSIPALRDRIEDIPQLALYFLAQATKRHRKEATQALEITPEAIDVLLGHSWPGNVRELSNVIERAVVFGNGGGGPIDVKDLPAHLTSNMAMRMTPKAPDSVSVKLGTPLKEVEDLLIRKTLEATDGDKTMTAKLLGINSRTIYRKLDAGKKSES